MRKYKPWCMHKICIQPRACVIMCFYIFLAHLHVCSRRVLGTWSSPIRNALIHPLRGIFVAGSHGDPVSGLHGYANEIVVTMQSLPTGCTKDIKLFILKESERRIQNNTKYVRDEIDVWPLNATKPREAPAYPWPLSWICWGMGLRNSSTRRNTRSWGAHFPLVSEDKKSKVKTIFVWCPAHRIQSCKIHQKVA